MERLFIQLSELSLKKIDPITYNKDITFCTPATVVPPVELT